MFEIRMSDAVRWTNIMEANDGKNEREEEAWRATTGSGPERSRIFPSWRYETQRGTSARTSVERRAASGGPIVWANHAVIEYNGLASCPPGQWFSQLTGTIHRSSYRSSERSVASHLGWSPVSRKWLGHRMKAVPEWARAQPVGMIMRKVTSDDPYIAESGYERARKTARSGATMIKDRTRVGGSRRNRERRERRGRRRWRRFAFVRVCVCVCVARMYAT